MTVGPRRRRRTPGDPTPTGTPGRPDLVEVAELCGPHSGHPAPVVDVPVLTMEVLVGWFRERAAAVRHDPAKLAVTALSEAPGRLVTCVQGVFDTDTRLFVEGDVRLIRAGGVDHAVRTAHTGRPITIWG